MHANVKALTHWAIYKGYKMRITERGAHEVQGIFTSADGTISFRYDAVRQLIYLENGTVQINEYGWEMMKSESNL